MVALPAFAVYANRPLLFTMSQHGARCSVGRRGRCTTRASRRHSTSYDDADPLPASDTITWPRVVKSKPNGVLPAAGVTTRVAERIRRCRSANVSSRLLTRSETMSAMPVRVDANFGSAVCAGGSAFVLPGQRA